MTLACQNKLNKICIVVLMCWYLNALFVLRTLFILVTKLLFESVYMMRNQSFYQRALFNFYLLIPWIQLMHDYQFNIKWNNWNGIFIITSWINSISSSLFYHFRRVLFLGFFANINCMNARNFKKRKLKILLINVIISICHF